jgi:hypothetical protein
MPKGRVTVRTAHPIGNTDDVGSAVTKNAKARMANRVNPVAKGSKSGATPDDV